MQFPKTRNFEGLFAPSGVEADVVNIRILEGKIPPELDGAFFRAAPDPQFPPMLGDDIWFNGDGMVARIRIKDGEASLKTRWVRTEKFKLEKKHGRSLFGNYRNPLTDDPLAKGVVRSTANTNVVVHAGKVYALKEDSPPSLIDPDTLETIDPVYRFGGKMTGETFTAHPKIDPKTGEMLAFGYAAKGLLTKDVAYYVINAKGELEREVWFEAPYYCMMHDYAVTEDYVLFHIVPSTSNWDWLKKGGTHFAFDTKLPVYLGVLPRNGTAKDMRWFTTPNLFASHVMNAYNVGTKIHFLTPTAKNNMFPFFPDIDGAPFKPEEAQSHLSRWTVDMQSNDDSIHIEQLTDLVGEFPRIDDRFATVKNRHGYMLVQDESKPLEVPEGRSTSGFIMNTLAHLDLETGEEDVWWAGPSASLQEPSFIPRPGSDIEGDGWLIVVESQLDDYSSRVLLLDAMKLAAGPVAVLELPFRLRPQVHGNWYNASQIWPS